MHLQQVFVAAALFLEIQGVEYFSYRFVLRVVFDRGEGRVAVLIILYAQDERFPLFPRRSSAAPSSLFFAVQVVLQDDGRRHFIDDLLAFLAGDIR